MRVQQRLAHGPQPQGADRRHFPLLLLLRLPPFFLGRRHEHLQDEQEEAGGARGRVAPRGDGGEERGDEVRAAFEELVRAKEREECAEAGVAGAAANEEGGLRQGMSKRRVRGGIVFIFLPRRRLLP